MYCLVWTVLFVYILFFSFSQLLFSFFAQQPYIVYELRTLGWNWSKIFSWIRFKANIIILFFSSSFVHLEYILLFCKTFCVMHIAYYSTFNIYIVDSVDAANNSEKTKNTKKKKKRKLNLENVKIDFDLLDKNLDTL